MGLVGTMELKKKVLLYTELLMSFDLHAQIMPILSSFITFNGHKERLVKIALMWLCLRIIGGFLLVSMMDSMARMRQIFS